MPWFVIQAPNKEQALRLSKNLQNAGTKVHYQDGRYEVFVGKRHISGLTKRALDFGGELIPRPARERWQSANGQAAAVNIAKYSCLACGQRFLSEALLRNHEEAAHPKDAQTEAARPLESTRRPVLRFEHKATYAAARFRQEAIAAGYLVYVLSAFNTGVAAPLSAQARLLTFAKQGSITSHGIVEVELDEFTLHDRCGFYVLRNRSAVHDVRCKRTSSKEKIAPTRFAIRTPNEVRALSRTSEKRVTLAEAVEAFGRALTLLGKALRKE